MAETESAELSFTGVRGHPANDQFHLINYDVCPYVSRAVRLEPALKVGLKVGLEQLRCGWGW